MQHLEDVAKVFINCQRLGSEFVCKKRNPSLTSHTAAPPLSNRASLRSQGSEEPEMGDEAICHFKILRPMFSFRLRDPQGSGKKMFRKELEKLIQACIYRLRGTCSGDLGPGTTYSFCSLPFRRSSLALSVREARNRPSGCVKFHIRDREPLTRLPGETRLVSERTWDERECSLQAKLFPRKHPKAWTGNPNLNFYEAGCSATADHEMSP